jgi:hypothetical protein
MVLAAVNGDYTTVGCDVLQLIYDGQVENGYYQGDKDNMANGGAYFFDIAMIGLSL